MKLILASQSPRRQELLSMITTDFEVRVSHTDETLAPGTPPEEAVALLARKKAQAVLGQLLREGRNEEPFWVIGSDTVVVMEGQILGKPHSQEECLAMLGLLSGRVHTVYTGVVVLSSRGEGQRFVQASQVEFYPLTQGEMAWYAATPEPYDKAGGYGIQGLGSVLVKGIQGDFFGVMGLPVAPLTRLLRQMGALPDPG